MFNDPMNPSGAGYNPFNDPGNLASPMNPMNPGHPGYFQPGGPGYNPFNDPGNPASPMNPMNPGHPGYFQPGGMGYHSVADQQSASEPYWQEPSTAPSWQEVKVELTLEEAAAGTCYKVGHSDSAAVVGIPRGIPNDYLVPLRSFGDPGVPGLLLRIGIRPHPVFRRDEANLHLLTNLEIDAYTANLGGEVKVPTLGEPVLLNIKPGTRNQQYYTLKDLGMPTLEDPDRRGLLIVQVSVHSP